MNMKQMVEKRKELAEIMKTIPEQRLFINYYVNENTIFGVPSGRTKNIVGYSVDNIDQHKLYLETKIEQLKLHSSVFNNSDPKLNKQIKNYELYLKRFKNAIKKLETKVV